MCIRIYPLIRVLLTFEPHSFNGWGVSVIDSLDTIFLMKLDDEFDRGIELVEKLEFLEKLRF